MGITINIQLSLSDAIATDALVSRNLEKMYATRSIYQDDKDPVPDWLTDAIEEKRRIHREFKNAIFCGQRIYFSDSGESEPAKNDGSPAKKPPVDRGKLLIGLECCMESECAHCPYDRETFDQCKYLLLDSLAYIGYLEADLEEAKKA